MRVAQANGRQRWPLREGILREVERRAQWLPVYDQVSAPMVIVPGPTDRIPINDLARGWIATSDDVRATVARVLASGWYVQGPEHDAFESELARFAGVRHAVGLASGTDALMLALVAVGCEAGEEIVTAANAGGYASVAAARIEARVEYADVDPERLVVTAATVAEAIGPTTRAVVVTHLYGNIADVPPIVELCHARGIAVVEDCAQAFGGTSEGRRAGSIGDVGTLSFYPTKNLGAAGDGGAVITDDGAIADRVRHLRQYGWEGRYRITRGGGINSRLDEVQAAILRIGLGRLDELTEIRRAIVRRYADVTQGTDIRMVTSASGSSAAHLAVVRAPDRARVRTTLDGLGIATDIHYPIPDHQQPGLAKRSRQTALPATDQAVPEILTLPCFPGMYPAEIDRVCSALVQAGAS